jgi:hypothetical protein
VVGEGDQEGKGDEPVSVVASLDERRVLEGDLVEADRADPAVRRPFAAARGRRLAQEEETLLDWIGGAGWGEGGRAPTLSPWEIGAAREAAEDPAAAAAAMSDGGRGGAVGIFFPLVGRRWGGRGEGKGLWREAVPKTRAIERERNRVGRYRPFIRCAKRVRPSASDRASGLGATLRRWEMAMEEKCKAR